MDVCPTGRMRSALLSLLITALVGEYAAPTSARTHAEEVPQRVHNDPRVTPHPPQRRGRGEFPAETLRVGGTERVYRLVVPDSVQLDKPAPLVIALHGILIDSKDLMPQYTKLNETARRHGFLLVYPDAIGRSWGLTPDKIKSDLAFFDGLLSQLSQDYRVDPRRIHVVGMSNGGYFAHLIGKERSQVVASIASHSGPLGLQTLLGIRADRKFPVMIIHGGRDPIFPFSFARENRDKYRREGHEVEYVELPHLGHRWAADVDINERIWAFFQQHPLPMRSKGS